eukprot:Gb_05969 [translate_table: standard]
MVLRQPQTTSSLQRKNSYPNHTWLQIRIQAIRGLPLLCKDTPEYVPKIVDVLGQLLLAEENLERDAVQKALMSVLRQDIKVPSHVVIILPSTTLHRLVCWLLVPQGGWLLLVFVNDLACLITMLECPHQRKEKLSGFKVVSSHCTT